MIKAKKPDPDLFELFNVCIFLLRILKYEYFCKWIIQYLKNVR